MVAAFSSFAASTDGQGRGREAVGVRVEGTCIFHELVHIKVKCTKRKRATEGQRAQDGAPVGFVKAQFKERKRREEDRVRDRSKGNVRYAGQNKRAA